MTDLSGYARTLLVANPKSARLHATELKEHMLKIASMLVYGDRPLRATSSTEGVM
jgi:hypothetical protein